MTEHIAHPQTSGNRPRPIGVWLLTIYALLFAGLAPLVLSIFLLVSGNGAGNGIGILLSVPVSLGVVISAVGAWKGNEKARVSLLIFVTLHYVLVGLNNYLLLRSGQVPEEELTRFVGRILRGLIYPAIYLLYFNRDTTKAFYNTREI